LRLGAARVAHRIDVDIQRVGQAAAHVLGRHVDQEGRQRLGAPLDVRSGPDGRTAIMVPVDLAAGPGGDDRLTSA